MSGDDIKKQIIENSVLISYIFLTLGMIGIYVINVISIGCFFLVLAGLFWLIALRR